MEASASLICEIDSSIDVSQGWAQVDVLKQLGATIKSEGVDGRVVEINGITYCEGLLEGVIREVDKQLLLRAKNGLIDE